MGTAPAQTFADNDFGNLENLKAGTLCGFANAPVIVKHGDRRLVANVLLDDASTKTYINGDLVTELGLEGAVQQITVNVLM